MASIIHKIALTIALSGLWVVGSQLAAAQPMRCSGEQKQCLANCNRALKRTAVAACITDCGARRIMCVRTGCWDNGTNRYCGLARQ